MAHHQGFSSTQYKYDEEKLKSYYNSLNREEFETLTKERIEEIVTVAKYYNESKKGTWYYDTIKVKFYEIVEKVRLLKNNKFFYTIPDFNHQREDSEYPNIVLQTDVEKILFIVSYCDSNNSLLSTWLNVKQNLANSSGQPVLSSSNYFKAKSIMQMYSDGFFNLKLILDEEKILSRITELEATETHKK